MFVTHIENLLTQQLHSISVNHSPSPISTPNSNPTNPNPNPYISLLSVQSYFSDYYHWV